MDIGKKIIGLRNEKGLSQNQLAKKAGISQSGLSYIEEGNKSPNLDTLQKICNALSIELIDLIKEIDIIPKENLNNDIRCEHLKNISYIKNIGIKKGTRLNDLTVEEFLDLIQQVNLHNSSD